MSSGHWYMGPDQAVVLKRLLTALHATVGDTIAITELGGRAIPIRIVGEVFDQEHDGLSMLTDFGGGRSRRSRSGGCGARG